MLDTKLLTLQKLIDFGYLVINIDSDGIVQKVNDNLIKLLKIRAFELEGKSFLKLLTENKTNEVFLNSFRHKDKFRGVIEICFKDNIFRFHTVMMPFYQDEKIETIAILSTNINRYLDENILSKKHNTDLVTGFFSKEKMLYDLEKITKKRDYSFIIFCIKNYENLESAYGEKNLNNLLKKFATFLTNTKPTKNTILYRVDLNKFVMLITREVSRWKFLEFIEKITKYISSKKFFIVDENINLSIIIGASQGNNFLYENALNALKKARKNDKEFALYEKGEVNLDANSKMIEIIKYAIKNSLVIPYFQPIVDLTTNKIKFYETLVRILDKDGNIYLPSEFLNISRDANLYNDIVYHMFLSAFHVYKNSNYKFTLNCYKSDLLNPQISKAFLQVIDEENIGNKLILEVIKDKENENYYDLDKIIRGYKAFGCQVAIDDFGDNYSLYKKLSGFNFNYIKIKQKYIENINNDKEKEEIVKNIIFYAKDANLKTIAEFVDNRLVLNKIRELGVDYAQGNYIAKPSRNIR